MVWALTSEVYHYPTDVQMKLEYFDGGKHSRWRWWEILLLGSSSFFPKRVWIAFTKIPQGRKKQIDRRETNRLSASFNISLPWSYLIWYLFIFFFFSFFSPNTLIHCKLFAYLTLTTSVSCEWLLDQLVSRFSYFLLVFGFHFWEFPKLRYLQLSYLTITVLM